MTDPVDKVKAIEESIREGKLMLQILGQMPQSEETMAHIRRFENLIAKLVEYSGKYRNFEESIDSDVINQIQLLKERHMRIRNLLDHTSKEHDDHIANTGEIIKQASNQAPDFLGSYNQVESTSGNCGDHSTCSIKNINVSSIVNTKALRDSDADTDETELVNFQRDDSILYTLPAQIANGLDQTESGKGDSSNILELYQTSDWTLNYGIDIYQLTQMLSDIDRYLETLRRLTAISTDAINLSPLGENRSHLHDIYQPISVLREVSERFIELRGSLVSLKRAYDSLKCTEDLSDEHCSQQLANLHQFLKSLEKNLEVTKDCFFSVANVLKTLIGNMASDSSEEKQESHINTTESEKCSSGESKGLPATHPLYCLNQEIVTDHRPSIELSGEYYSDGEQFASQSVDHLRTSGELGVPSQGSSNLCKVNTDSQVDNHEKEVFVSQEKVNKDENSLSGSDLLKINDLELPSQNKKHAQTDYIEPVVGTLTQIETTSDSTVHLSSYKLDSSHLPTGQSSSSRDKAVNVDLTYGSSNDSYPRLDNSAITYNATNFQNSSMNLLKGEQFHPKMLQERIHQLEQPTQRNGQINFDLLQRKFLQCFSPDRQDPSISRWRSFDDDTDDHILSTDNVLKSKSAHRTAIPSENEKVDRGDTSVISMPRLGHSPSPCITGPIHSSCSQLPNMDEAKFQTPIGEHVKCRNDDPNNIDGFSLKEVVYSLLKRIITLEQSLEKLKVTCQYLTSENTRLSADVYRFYCQQPMPYFADIRSTISPSSMNMQYLQGPASLGFPLMQSTSVNIPGEFYSNSGQGNVLPQLNNQFTPVVSNELNYAGSEFFTGQTRTAPFSHSFTQATPLSPPLDEMTKHFQTLTPRMTYQHDNTFRYQTNFDQWSGRRQTDIRFANQMHPSSTNFEQPYTKEDHFLKFIHLLCTTFGYPSSNQSVFPNPQQMAPVSQPGYYGPHSNVNQFPGFSISHAM